MTSVDAEGDVMLTGTVWAADSIGNKGNGWLPQPARSRRKGWLQEWLDPGFLRRHHNHAVSTLHIACHLSLLRVLASQVFHEDINRSPAPRNPEEHRITLSLSRIHISSLTLLLLLLFAWYSGPLRRQRSQGPCAWCPSGNTYCGGQVISKRTAEGETKSRHPLHDVDKKKQRWEETDVASTQLQSSGIIGHCSSL